MSSSFTNSKIGQTVRAKKFTIFGITLLPLLMLILAACGDNPTPTISATQAAQATTQPAAPTSNPTAAAPATTAAQPEVKLQVGFTAPDFSAKTLTGETIQLSQMRGKAVLLDFWATYCPGCRQHAPELNQVYGEHKDRLTIVGINWKESEGEIQNFVNQFKITYPIVPDKNGDLLKQYRAISHPYYILLDAQGIIKAIIPGQLPAKDLIGLIVKTINLDVANANPVATQPANLEVAPAPDWFASVPKYDKGTKIPLDGPAIVRFGYNPAHYYVTGMLSPESISAITTAHLNQMTADGWQAVEQAPIIKEELGQIIYFTKGQEANRKVVQIVVMSKEAFAANPRTKDSGLNFPAGMNLIATVAYNG